MNISWKRHWGICGHHHYYPKCNTYIWTLKHYKILDINDIKCIQSKYKSLVSIFEILQIPLWNFINYSYNVQIMLAKMCWNTQSSHPNSFMIWKFSCMYLYSTLVLFHVIPMQLAVFNFNYFWRSYDFLKFMNY